MAELCDQNQPRDITAPCTCFGIIFLCCMFQATRCWGSWCVRLGSRDFTTLLKVYRQNIGRMTRNLVFNFRFWITPHEKIHETYPTCHRPHIQFVTQECRLFGTCQPTQLKVGLFDFVGVIFPTIDAKLTFHDLMQAQHAPSNMENVMGWTRWWGRSSPVHQNKFQFVTDWLFDNSVSITKHSLSVLVIHLCRNRFAKA